VAYYTNDAYKREADKLGASLSELCIGFAIYAVYELAARGWKAAVMHKPRFILECLQQWEDYDILYTDADSIFRCIPDWRRFNTADLAGHLFTRSRHHGPELLTGTLFFKNNPRVHDFVRRWVEITTNFQSSPTPEQESLAHLVKHSPEIKFKDFGPEMVWIFDDFRAIYPQGRPIIEHFQASRRLRLK